MLMLLLWKIFSQRKKSSYRPDYKLVVISIFVMVFGRDFP